MELSPRDELWLIRRELDRLTEERLRHFFTVEEDVTYELLAARELALLELTGGSLGLEEEIGDEPDEPLDLTESPADAFADGGEN